MTLTPLPLPGNTSWHAWAQSIHNNLKLLHGENVKEYGATGDGVTDDYPALQAALDAVPVGGGIVYLPAGDYAVSQTVKVTVEGTCLIGAGGGARVGSSQSAIGSRIKAIGAISGAVVRVQRTANDRPMQGTHIKDLAVDGNNLGTLVDGIHFRSNMGSIENVHIWNCTGNGLRVQGYASPNWDTYDTRFSHLVIGYCAGGGVLLDNNAADLHFSHCIFLQNNDNFILRGSSLQATGCHFYTAARYNIWFDGNGSRSKFANCKIEGCSSHQVYIDTTNGGYSDVQFTGCGFSSINQAITTNTVDYVHITGTSSNGASRFTFIGNSFNNKGGSAVKARYAINLNSSAAQGTVIQGNSFGPASHWGTAALKNDSNSSTLPYVRGNSNLPNLHLPNVKTASYTLVFPDDALDNPVEMSSATAVTVTVPPNADPGFMKGNRVTVVQTGAGQVTFAAGAGVTLRTPRSLTTRAQWSTVTLRQTASNVWILEGDLT